MRLRQQQYVSSTSHQSPLHPVTGHKSQEPKKQEPKKIQITNFKKIREAAPTAIRVINPSPVTNHQSLFTSSPVTPSLIPKKSVPLPMQKPALRQLYNQKRLGLSAAEIRKMEDRMLHHFMQFHWPPVKELFTYIPISRKNEPDPLPFIRFIQSSSLMQTGIACRISAPVISNEEESAMQAVSINETTNYHTGKLGTTEPEITQVIPPQQIDMILVPLLVFDTSGNRIGYGKGYYDRFMAQCRSNTIRAGLSFFGPEPAIEHRPGFDVPLTHCITPEQVYVF